MDYVNSQMWSLYNKKDEERKEEEVFFIYLIRLHVFVSTFMEKFFQGVIFYSYQCPVVTIGYLLRIQLVKKVCPSKT